MSGSPISTSAPPSTPRPAAPTEVPADDGHGAAKSTPRWQRYGTPILVVLLAIAVVATVTWKWNSWEGGKVEQVTDDAYVRGDLTPLSTTNIQRVIYKPAGAGGHRSEIAAPPALRN